MSEDITLTQINPGEDADADVLMGNFNTLKNVLSSTNTRLDAVSDAASSALSGSFPKSGGTLTGNLTISKSAPYIYLKNTAQTAGTPPQSSATERIYFKDSADVTLGQVSNIYNSDGSRYSTLTSANGNGSASTYIRVGFDKDGNEYFSFPKCTTAASTTSSATSNLVAVIVKNYKNGASWYRVWSDGWIEQGGNAKNGTTVSLIKNFTTTNYTVVATKSTTTYDDNFELLSITSKTTSGFYLSQSGFTYGIYANWYACGY